MASRGFLNIPRYRLKPSIWFASLLSLVGTYVVSMTGALAYCTLPTAKYPFLCDHTKLINVYINDDVNSIARVGLEIDDIERLVRSAIAAYNESAVTLPRLVYGGRVSHDTRWTEPTEGTLADHIAEYKQARLRGFSREFLEGPEYPCGQGSTDGGWFWAAALDREDLADVNEALDSPNREPEHEARGRGAPWSGEGRAERSATHGARGQQGNSRV